jgi:hypothetical protein
MKNAAQDGGKFPTHQQTGGGGGSQTPPIAFEIKGIHRELINYNDNIKGFFDQLSSGPDVTDHHQWSTFFNQKRHNFRHRNLEIRSPLSGTLIE